MGGGLRLKEFEPSPAGSPEMVTILFGLVKGVRTGSKQRHRPEGYGKPQQFPLDQSGADLEGDQSTVSSMAEYI